MCIIVKYTDNSPLFIEVLWPSLESVQSWLRGIDFDTIFRFDFERAYGIFSFCFYFFFHFIMATKLPTIKIIFVKKQWSDTGIALWTDNLIATMGDNRLSRNILPGSRHLVTTFKTECGKLSFIIRRMLKLWWPTISHISTKRTISSK